MATANVAISSVLDTVTQTAKTVGNVINVVGTGAQMLNDAVDDLRDKQSINIKLGRVGFTEAAINARMLEIDQISERTEIYMNEVPGRKERCAKIREELEKALA